MLRDFRKAGEVLNARYRIDGVLGKGGSSNVYFGKHLGLDMEVAIKEISAEKLGKISAANEALLLKEIRHPALPNIMDIFDEDGYTYIIREYCRGEDIRKNIHQSGPYSLDKCKLIVKHLSSVLNYLHSQEPALIYRDLKPSNVIIDEKSNIKLIDFGISRKFDQEKKDDTQYMGSRKYAAPEQFGLGQSSPKTDIYSLGMLLYFMYTGEDYCDLEEDEKWLKFRSAKEVQLKSAIIKSISFRPEERQNNTKEFMEEAFGPEPESTELSEDTELLEQAIRPSLRLSSTEPELIREDYSLSRPSEFNRTSSGGPERNKRERVQLGFFGLKSGVGVSHLALSAALSYSRRGYKTILCERSKNSAHSLLSAFINGEDIDEEVGREDIKLEKLRIVLSTSNNSLPSLLSEDYDLILFDFGSGQSALGDFLRLPNKYLVLPSAPYAFNRNLDLIREMGKYRDLHYIFNLSTHKTESVVKWLRLHKLPHLNLGFLDYDKEGDETGRLLDFLEPKCMNGRRRSFIGRLLK